MVKDQESFDKDIEELMDLFKEFNLKNYIPLATIRNKYNEMASSYPELIFKKNAYKFINIFDEIFLDNDNEEEEDKGEKAQVIHNLYCSDKNFTYVDHLWFTFTNANSLKVMYGIKCGEVENEESILPIFSPIYVIDVFEITDTHNTDAFIKNLKDLAKRDDANKNVYNYIDTYDGLRLLTRTTSNKSLLDALYG